MACRINRILMQFTLSFSTSHIIKSSSFWLDLSWFWESHILNFLAFGEQWLYLSSTYYISIILIKFWHCRFWRKVIFTILLLSWRYSYLVVRTTGTVRVQTNKHQILQKVKLYIQSEIYAYFISVWLDCMFVFIIKFK